LLWRWRLGLGEEDEEEEEEREEPEWLEAEELEEPELLLELLLHKGGVRPGKAGRTLWNLYQLSPDRT